MRVLVVEGDERLGEVFHDQLVELGHQPFSARSAAAARALMREVRPEAILVDVRLPDMSGLDFLRLPETRELGVPVIVMSAAGADVELNEALRLGAVDYVDKPLDVDHLRDILRCLEPLAEPVAAGIAHRQHERRLAPRARVTVPVRVAEYAGNAWDGMTVDLSTGGVKVRTSGAIAPATVAKMSFALEESKTSFQVVSVLVREDADGYAFRFMNLADWQEARLREFVDRRLNRPAASDLHERVLRSVTHAFATSLDLDETLRLALHALTRVTGHEISFLHLFSADRSELVLKGERGLSARLREASHVLPAGTSLIARAATTGETLRVDDLAAAAGEVWPAAAALLREENIGAFVCVPLQTRGGGLGTLSLARTNPRAFDESEIALLESIATQLALALDNARLQTEMQRQLQELRQAQTQMVQSEGRSTLGKLSAGIVHEINNPLTAILTQATILLREIAGPPRHQERIAAIMQEATRAARLLTSLLRLSRPRRTQRLACALDGEVRALAELTRPASEEAGITTVLELGEVPPVWVDPDEIRQVLLNLVRNAQHALANHPGQRVLTIRTRATQDRVWVEVSDSGPGIPEAVLPRIFDAFFTTKPEGEGTGLGLWVSSDIAEQHGGRLYASNRPEGGAVFTLELPLRRRD